MQIWFAQGRNPVTALIASQRSRSEAGFKLGKDTHLRSRLLHLDVRQSQQSDYND